MLGCCSVLSNSASSLSLSTTTGGAFLLAFLTAQGLLRCAGDRNTSKRVLKRFDDGVLVGDSNKPPVTTPGFEREKQ